MQEVKKYCETINADLKKGTAFYNHFQSNGWLVSGKAKMVDWEAALRGWVEREFK